MNVKNKALKKEGEQIMKDEKLVEETTEKWRYFCSKINFGQSALDAKSIQIMNNFGEDLQKLYDAGRQAKGEYFRGRGWLDPQGTIDFEEEVKRKAKAEGIHKMIENIETEAERENNVIKAEKAGKPFVEKGDVLIYNNYFQKLKKEGAKRLA